MNKVIIYKEKIPKKDMFVEGGNKKAQVTIFVILAIVLVAAIVIFFAVSDYGRGLIDRVSGQEFDVEGSLIQCIDSSEIIDNGIKIVLSQGGSLDPKLYYLYNNTKLRYLCFTNDNYVTCINQEPLLIQHVESEINKAIKPGVESCIDNLNKQLENRGYKVQAGKLNISVDLIPDNILVKINYPISIERAEQSKSFDGFNIKKKSKAYHLISLSTSILNYEARYGDSETTVYMVLYPKTKVEKLKQGDGTKVYRVSNRDTKEVFSFATRSLVFPPGYQL